MQYHYCLILLQSSILNANISETDLAMFVNMLNQSLWMTPPTSGDLSLVQDLLNRSVAVFDSVESREVAHIISQVFHAMTGSLHNTYIFHILGYCVITKCTVRP